MNAADPGAGAAPAFAPGTAPAIEEARPEDVAELARIAAEALPGAFSADGFRDELARDDAHVWVVRRSGRVQGYLAARVLDDVVEVLSIAVVPAARRSGVGRALIAHAITAAPAGARLDLEVRAGDAGAQAFYGALGFVAVGRRPRYYRGGEDAVLMTREAAPADKAGALP